MSSKNNLINEFREHYFDAVQKVVQFFDDSALNLIATHNPGWNAERFDVEYYLNASIARYEKIFTYMINSLETQSSKLLDVGGFFGVFPLAVSKMGYSVTLAEKYSYYYGAFDKLRDFLMDHDISILDADFVTDEIESQDEKFDYVTCLAVIEHIADSPKKLMSNIKRTLKDGGYLLIDVPNISYWPNRINFMLGKTIHPPLKDVFDSKVPFVGHHREYTLSDLEELILLSEMSIENIETINYTPWPKGNWKQKILLEWPVNNFKTFREVIIGCARKVN